MDKQRKDDHKYAVDIDTTPENINYNRIGFRSVNETVAWKNPIVRFFVHLYDTPARLFQEKVEQIRGNERPFYYHKKFKRVPTIDECYTDDLVCIHEANVQVNRDMRVDEEILLLLKHRLRECISYHGYNDAVLCEKIRDDLNKADFNYQVKYGEIRHRNRAQDIYMKQKHRLIMERRKKLKEEAEGQSTA